MWRRINITKRTAIGFVVKVGTLVFAGILSCIILSNFSLWSPNWPFGLVASFSDSLLLVFPAIFVAILLSWRRAAGPIFLLALIAFYPVYRFKDYVTPTQQACGMDECLSIVAANLRHHPEALRRLADSHAKKADILMISELPHDATSEVLRSLFPMEGQAQVSLITEPQRQLGSRLAIISRIILEDVTLEIEAFPMSKLRSRGFATFDVALPSGEALSFVFVHAPPPKGKFETSSRDTYLRRASQSLSDRSDFIMIGDFNMTPWEPEFSALPGRRAGNPRWRRTWNARKFWQHIAIDHALVGAGVDVVQYEVLEDVGSDHFPIQIVIRNE